MVCFACRKTFKAVLAYDMMKRDGVWKKVAYLERRARKDHPQPLTEAERELYMSLYTRYEKAGTKCPDCGGKMADVGLDYRAPQKTDVRAWKMLKSLYTTGFNFNSCGCSGPGLIPKNKEQYEAHLKDRLETFTGNAKLNRYNDREYWAEKARLVQTELKKINTR